MEMPLALGDARALAVVLYQFIEPAATDGGMVAREEQDGDVAVTLFQIGFNGFEFIGLQRVQSGKRVFEAVNSKPVLLQVEVCGLELPNFGGSEAMAVGEEEDSIVALRVYGIEHAAHLILGQEVDGGRRPMAIVSRHVVHIMLLS